ncbi:uncharacterized protein VTP21DRAFT_6208 [Calcarisporiella thermophila]|uniref:uncharacterized protein n=1 Tax=Calcarisporiella thermophila TaxID=911321 RepID=UPI003743D385
MFIKSNFTFSFGFSESRISCTDYSSLTYIQFDLITNREARRWASLINRGSYQNTPFNKPIALLAQTCPTYLCTLFAFPKLRVPLLLLSPKNSSAAIAHLYKESGASAMIVDGELLNTNLQVIDGPIYSLEKVKLEELAQSTPENKAETAPLENDEGAGWDEPAFILHSSGSTGFPKIVKLPYSALIMFSAVYHTLGDFPGGKDDTILCLPPLFHGFGANISVSSALLDGLTIALPLSNSWPPKPIEVLNSLARSKANVLYLVPSLLDQIFTALEEGFDNELDNQNYSWDLLNLSNISHLVVPHCPQVSVGD